MKLVNKKEIPIETCYDLSVEKNHNFFANGICVHNTNSAIAKDLTTGDFSIQSRQRIITIEDDNYGFARFCQALDLRALFNMIQLEPNYIGDDEENAVVIYGEWCGGSIQDNVGLCQLDKMFVIFAIMYQGVFIPESIVKNVKMCEHRVFNIFDFPAFEIEIDFQNPELVQNRLGEITTEVEKECPVSKALGVIGTGEGVVWSPIDPIYTSPVFWFKVKGDKHSASKVTKLASVDTEKVNSMNELLDKVVTENRMVQGTQVIKSKLGITELTRANTGDLIRWVFDDVVKEEIDTVTASGFNQKDIGAPISKRVKEWFFKNVV